VKNPGIPYTIEPIRRAITLGIEVVTEVEVGFRISEAPMIGITGSNGKTTTTTWTGLMLDAAGLKPVVTGNIGRALTEASLEVKNDNWLVVELSSFQLKGTSAFRPRIGCLLNVYETHLDYHGLMEDYIESKVKLFANQTEEDTAVQSTITQLTRGLLPPLGLVGVAFGLIMLQPDLGTGVVLFGASLLIIYTAGARLLHLSYLGMVGLAGFVGLIIAAPYRFERITSFLDPWKDPLGGGYQIIQSVYAIGPGGLMGLGLGMSRQKYSYLPEPQTDFIFSIIAEELGFIGGSFVLVLFTLLLWRGMRTAITAPDTFGSLLATGIVGMIAVQVIINIGVVIGMFPVTGITIPLISAGGSSLTLMLTSIGVLLNISRYSR
jgi:hypothetical protein